MPGFLRDVGGVPGAGGGAGGGGGFTAGASTHGNTAGITGLVGSQILFVGSNNITLSESVNGNSATLSIIGGAGAGGGIAAAAGSQTGTSGTIVFSNSNGITFGMSNSSVVTASYTVPSTAGLLTAVNVSAGTTSNNLSALTFANSNGISFGINASTVTATVATNYAASDHSHGNPTLALTNLSGTTASNSAGLTLSLSAAAPGGGGNFSAGVSTGGNTAGDTGITGTRLVLAGGNNITVSQGTDANGATVTVSGAAQTNQSIGLYASSNTTLTSSGTVDARSMTIRGVGAISVGVSASQYLISSPQTSSLSATGIVSLSENGSTISIGVGPATAYAVSNTTQSTSGAFDLRSMSFHGAGGVSVGVSNGSVVISGGTGGGAGYTAGLSNIGNTAGDTGAVTGRLVFAGGNNVTLSGSTNAGSMTITVSAGGGNNFSAGLSNLGNTAGATGLTGTQMVLVGSGPISLSQTTGANGGTISINAPATSSLSATGIVSISTNGSTISIGAGPMSAFAVSNTTQSSSGAIDARSLSFHGAGIASVGVSNGSIVISVPSGGGAGDGVNILAAGTQTAATTGTVLFNNGNGITFGMSNSSVITASHNGLTTARASNDAIGLNTALTAGPLAWTVNSSGLSLNAGSAAGTTSGFGGNLISGSMTHNTAGLNLSLSHPAWLTTAMQSNAATISNIRVSAGTTSNLLSAVTFANGNGVFFGLDAGTVTASHNGLTTARASTDAIGLNTAQSNVTWTVNSSGLSLDARGYAGTATAITGGASITLNSGGLSFNGTALAGTGTTFNGANISGSMTVNTGGVQLSMSVAAPGAAAENNAINLLGANTAGNTTATGSTIGWSGLNLTLSGTNASQIVVSAPATSSLSATGQVSISTNGSTISIGVGRTISGLVLAPFAGAGGPVPFAQSSISLGQNSLYVYPVQVEDYLSVDHIRMPVLITNSSSAAASVQKGLTYQVGIYTRHSTNGTVLTRHYSTSYTIAASHNSNASWMVSLITAIGNSTSYNTLTASSAGLNLSSSVHGPRELILPVSSVLTPGDYWIAVAASTSSVGAGGAVLNISNMAVAYQTYDRIGVATNATGTGFYKHMFMGTYSATTGALPASINQTQINQLGTMPFMFAATGTV